MPLGTALRRARTHIAADPPRWREAGPPPPVRGDGALADVLGRASVTAPGAQGTEAAIREGAAAYPENLTRLAREADACCRAIADRHSRTGRSAQPDQAGAMPHPKGREGPNGPCREADDTVRTGRAGDATPVRNGRQESPPRSASGTDSGAEPPAGRRDVGPAGRPEEARDPSLPSAVRPRSESPPPRRLLGEPR